MGGTFTAMEFIGIGLGVMSIIFAVWLSIRTDKLLEKEDRIAKQLIDEGNKRTQQMLERTHQMLERTQQLIEEGNRRTQQMIEEGNKRVEKILAKMDENTRYLAELLERVDRRLSEKTYIVRDQ